MSNRRKVARPRVECPDCASRLLSWPGPGDLFLAHDETCPAWRARTAAVRAVIGEDVLLFTIREVPGL